LIVILPLLPVALGAALLFVLELLAGRLVLPVFGGGPAVWTTSLALFTTVVLAGYAYAHLLVTRVAPARQPAVQVGVLAVALVAFLLVPAEIATLRIESMPPALNVILAVGVIAGPAAFALSSTTPLLSRWLAGTGRSPWWLYAVSNAASLLGLLLYPFVLEPLLGLSAQRTLIAAGLLVQLGLTVLAVRTIRAMPPVEPEPEPDPVLPLATDEAPVPTAGSGRSMSAKAARRAAARPDPQPESPPALPRSRWAWWIAGAFVPAGLMAATTTFLQQDLVSAPLIWVWPLAVYLLSFVVAFSRRGGPVVRGCLRAVPVALPVLIAPIIVQSVWPLWVILPLELAGLFVLATALHGRLAAIRPAPDHLTGYYLAISAGGALATGFVALVAPVIFNDVWEYPLLLCAALVVLAWIPGVRLGRFLAPVRWEEVRGVLISLALYGIVAGGVYLALLGLDPQLAGTSAGFLASGIVLVLLAIRPRLVAIAGSILIVGILLIQPVPFLKVRTFFGVITVDDIGAANLEYHGTTLHGLQFSDDRFAQPTTYYAETGPLGGVFTDLRARTSAPRIGAVGLGVGTVAAYARDGDTFGFFEIDPTVEAIARDERYFTYLKNAAVPIGVVIGDARISLQREADASFDLLILDAFSSDSVPVHLMTREAAELYRRVIRPGGVIAWHLSSRYYDLVPGVATTVRSIGLVPLVKSSWADAGAAEQAGIVTSLWLVSVAEADAERFRADGWQDIPEGGPLFTDDRADLLALLR